MRIAAGACVVITGLLVASAGGGIASADSDSAAAAAQAAQTQTGGGSQSGGSNTGSADSLAKAAQTAAQGVASAAKGIVDTVGSVVGAGQRAAAGAGGHLPVATFGGTPTVFGSIAPDPAPPPPAAATIASDHLTTVPPPATEPAAVVPPVSGVDRLAAATSNVVTPASHVAAALTSAVGSVPGVVAALPGSATPVTDVLTSLQTTLTSVADAAAPLAQVPSDLSDLINGLYGTPATPTEGVGSSRSTIHAAAAPLVLPETSALSQVLLPTAPSAGGPEPVDVAAAPLGGQRTPTSSAGSIPDAVVASNGNGADGVLSTVEKVIGAVVASVSVLALLLLALPGVGGILLTWAAGMRIGYRQAKAAAALPPLDAARFVGSGPMGVVRSGAQVKLGSRTAGARRATTPDAAPLARVISLRSVDRVA